MFSKNKPESPRVITADEENLIIWKYLNRITPVYRDQPYLTVETMLQMEKNIIVAQTNELSIVNAHLAQSR